MLILPPRSNTSGYVLLCFQLSLEALSVGLISYLAMTLDRLIAVKWPLKSLTWCTMKRARVTTACAITFSFLVKLPYAWITKSLPRCAPFQMKTNTPGRCILLDKLFSQLLYSLYYTTYFESTDHCVDA